MSNLLSTLLTSTNALRAYDQALNVVQNNVSNASTPGYARQTQVLNAERFAPEAGFTGGVRAGEILGRRSEYAEAAVRQQESGVGFAEQRRASLEQLEPLFSPSKNSGIAAAFSSFFQAFSDVSVNPNSSTGRQAILERSAGVARAIREAASGVQSAREATDRQLRTTVDEINTLLQRIADFNVGRRSNAGHAVDPGVDANLHDALDRLAELVDFQALEAPDRSVTILIGGSETAVIGDHVYPLLAPELSESAATVRGFQGSDLSSIVHGGRLGALLDVRNTSLREHLESLNTLAVEFSATINSKLAAGVDQHGNSPDAAHALFTFGNASYPALTLTTNDLDPSELALSWATAPGGAGNALDIAELGSRRTIDQFTFTEFYGNIGASVGREIEQARDARQIQAALLSQSKTLREQLQGVSLDEEAAILMVYQKGYEASARIVSVIDELTESVLNLIR